MYENVCHVAKFVDVQQCVVSFGKMYICVDVQECVLYRNFRHLVDLSLQNIFEQYLGDYMHFMCWKTCTKIG